MEKIKKIYIDWIKTGRKLYYLRTRNEKLLHNVCEILSRDVHDSHQCENGYNCQNCLLGDNLISQEELAKVFAVTNDVISNWENGITSVPLEYLLLYCDLCEIDRNKVLDIIVIVN